MRILIVEDDKRLARLIERVLLEERHTVDVAHDGESGLDMLLQGVYDVAVIDWMLPGRDGPSLCRAARAARLPTALLLLTARGQIEDKMLGFESGADDYLVKPFAFEELLARVRALGRRFNPLQGTDELRIGSIVLDLRNYTARRGERRLDLTPTEWRLLEYLLRNAGQTLTRQQILDYVWSFEHDVQPQMVDVYISYLRRKLNAPGETDPILTIRGIGYRLEAERA
ncbi:MAG: DNA-binding response regulator [Chloroflexus sp.]|uniref:response regulator transcription factor n=1 Tax=Chloroflexus sp. TaxID=1904827 RepID=UPI0021DECF1C|nr:response regulator transcription factor [Chloroflexus sp.]GIV89055.1 MAG: DNA-binding response regulator [Chloroflexus sp.]